MNKTAIKNFAIWARNKLIKDIQYKAGLVGITAEGIKSPLAQSTGATQFFDIGSIEPFAIHGVQIRQRDKLVDLLKQKTNESDYATAYKYIIEEVAYTWFNRLIAIRFMEVNDYLPSHIRVLSSETGKMEPDLVTNPFDAELEFTGQEESIVIQLQQDNKIDELFRMLFVKQCNALNEILPALFEKTDDYMELLLNLSVIDKEGVVYRLVNDIPEEDFDVERGGQVEIIGWLYQYYNTEPKNEAFAKKSKITKDEIPAVTQLFTPDWIVRYMVENSLGRLWLDGHPDEILKSQWKYYLDEAEQEPEVQIKLDEIKREHAKLNPEDIKLIDPCMGSGHILVYAFDVLMQIYESVGWSQRDAAKSILENNIYGLDIDDRAGQMAYFAIMMKARQYNRRILSANIPCHVYAIKESNSINRNQLQYLGAGMSDFEKNSANNQMIRLLDTFRDAKEYGSILNIDNYDWDLLRRFIAKNSAGGQMNFDMMGIDEMEDKLKELIDIAQNLSQKYEVSITNPPYMGSANMSSNLFDYVMTNFAEFKTDLFAVFILKLKDFTKENYYYSLITQQAWMFKSSYRKLRPDIYSNAITSLIQLGAKAFDDISGEVVQTVSFCQLKRKINRYIGKYYNIEEPGGEEAKKNSFLEHENEYLCRIDNFSNVPNMPTSYWLTDKGAELFKYEKSLDKFITACAGLNTSDNDRFIRYWQEIKISDIGFNCDSLEHLWASNKKYALFNKGGGYRKWYGNQYYAIKFDEHNYNVLSTIGNHLPSRQHYFKKAITWNRIAYASTFSARFCNNGFAFDDVSPSAFGNDNMRVYSCAFMNTVVFKNLLCVMNRGMKTETGNVQKVPFIYDSLKNDKIIEITNDNKKISVNDWDSFEISWDFMFHPLTKGIANGKLISDKFKEWEFECNTQFQQLKANEEELNRIFIDIYGLQDELKPEIEDKDVTIRKADLQRDIKSLLSYAVGCMFGRYSLDTEGLIYAGGEWDSSKYSTFIPDIDGIIPITDEEYFNDDIVGLFCGWLKKVYGADTLEENLDFIAKALGKKGSSSREIIRNYFLTDFFKDHCSTYSVTGSGKRPIYWLFDSGKQNGFKALIYLHRYTPDTIGNLRVDYLHRMQRVYESEINRMQDMMDHSSNGREVAAATKRKEKLQKQLKECRDYDEKIGHLALSRIELDLDDGVKYNYRKIQTANDGKFYEVLADSKAIMMDAKKYKDFK